MMIAIYLPGEIGREDGQPGPRSGFGRTQIIDGIRTALGTDGAEARVVWTYEADEAREKASEADCLVLVLPAVEDPERRFLGELPEWVPKVLVTEEPGGAALKLRRLIIEEIVPLDEVESELDGAIGRAQASGLLGQAGALVENLEGLSPGLRDWILTVLRTFPPPSTVEAGARLTGCTRSTVRRHWKQEIGRSSPCVFNRWVFLLRAMVLKQPAVSWPEVAEKLARSKRTLERAAQDLAGTDLDSLLNRTGRRTLGRRFEKYLVWTLVERDSRTVLSTPARSRRRARNWH